LTILACTCSVCYTARACARFCATAIWTRHGSTTGACSIVIIICFGTGRTTYR
jgi:hypothetical protein